MKYFFTILLFHFFLVFNAQIIYTKIPLDLQLVARDKVTNLGNVTIEGNVDFSNGYNLLRVETYRNNLLLNTIDQSLVYIDTKASFVFNTSIPAELANYSFKIYGHKLSDDTYELDKTISNIVAGDTFVIQGQSNAVASIRKGSANSNKSDFIRVYASATANFESLLSNDAWYIADGDGGATLNGNTGQWGLKLARLLLDNLNIPIAIFNGAHSGQRISFFKPPQDYKTSLSSNYGRLYYRLKKTGLTDNVRAVFWSQGEANAGSLFSSISDYKKNFKILENSWVTDFPNLEKVYIFQTKDCTCNATPEGLMNIKEAQRQLAEESEKISIMPTTSLLLHVDDCHFPFKNGYESFADRIYKIVLQDIYEKPYTEEVSAPMIKNIEFTEPNVLILETDAKELLFSSIDQVTMLTRLKQDFELKNAQSVSIESVVLSANKIIFTLSGNPGTIATISFVGYNSNNGFTITNSSDLELTSFRNFPIKNLSINNGDNSNYPIIEDAHICILSGSTSTLSVLSPIANITYNWFYKTPDGAWTEIKSSNASTVYSNYNSPILDIKKSSNLPISGTVYKVVADNGIVGKFTSNEANLTFDTAPVSKLITGDLAICGGNSTNLVYGIDSKGTIQWQYSTTSGLEDFIDLDDENGVSHNTTNLQQSTWFRVMNSNGVCAADYSPAVQVIVTQPAVAGYISGGNISVCRTSNSTALSLNNYVGKIQWQKSLTISGTYSNILSATSALYTASALTTTAYFRAVLSNGVCTPQITESVVIQVVSSNVSKTIISGASTVCFGDSKTLTYDIGSVGTIQWQFSTESSLSGFINILGENGLTYTAANLQQTTWFRVMNSNGGCNVDYSPAVQVMVNPAAVAGFISGGNISVCRASNSTALSLNNYVGKIQWQKSSTISGTYTAILYSNTPLYTASNLTTTTYFRAVLSNGVCTPQITESVAIQVESSAVSKTIGGASAACFGDSKTLTYGTDSVGTIQWQFSTISGSSGFINLMGENDLIYKTTNLEQTSWFRVVNTIGNCSTAYSPAVQVTVNLKPVAGFITGGDVNVCKSSNTTVLKLQNYAGTIQWQKSSTITGIYSNIPTATSSLYTASGLITTTYFRAILSSGMCPIETTVPVAINITQNDAIAKTISGASSVCAGDNLTLNYEEGSLGNIQWQFSTSSSTSGYNDINGANGQEHSVNNLQQSTWFRVKNSIDNCSTVYSPSVQVTVNLKPIAGFITGGNVNVCKSSNATTLVLNKSLGTIQWQKSPTEFGTYSNIIPSNSTSYNVSGLLTSGYFRAILSSGVCTAQTTEPVYIKVDEPAVVKTITGATPICFGESQTLFYESGSVGTIQWQYSTTSNTSGFTDKIGENELTYSANNLQQTTWFRVKNTSGVCPINYSAPVQILVNTTPPPFGSKTQYFDFNNPVSVSNLVVKGADSKWYSTYSDALSKTNDLQSSTMLTPGSTYYATQTLNGCVSISPLAITVTDTLEIEGFNIENLEFYPNPFKNFFKLKYPEVITSLELYNSLGQSVLKTNLNAKEKTLNVDNLPSGIYFMELKTKNNKGVIKAIKL